MRYVNSTIATQVFTVIIAIISLATTNAARSAGNWTLGVTPQVLYSQYSDSVQRDGMWSYGLSVNADYLEKASLAVGYTRTKVLGKPTYPDINENALYLSGRTVRYSDLLVGKLGLRFDAYNITDKTKVSQDSNQTLTVASSQINNSLAINNKVTKGKVRRNPGGAGTTTTTLTDNVAAYYFQLDYMNYAERFYADFGYAYSDYQYEENEAPYQNIKIHQFTTTGGMALNNRYDWLHTRIYFIDLEHGENTGGRTNSTAVEFKWLHWFKPNALLNAHSTLLKVMVGKRLFAVDPDAAAVYSLSDMQTSSVAGGLDWKIGEQSKFFLLLGYDRFEDTRIDNQYSARYIYSNISINW